MFGVFLKTKTLTNNQYNNNLNKSNGGHCLLKVAVLRFFFLNKEINVMLAFHLYHDS